MIVSEVQGTDLMFNMEFDNPSAISVGSKPDAIIAKLVNPDFFSSQESAGFIAKDTAIKFTLPRMLESQETWETL